MSKTTLPPEAAVVEPLPASIPTSRGAGRNCLCAATPDGTSAFLVLDGSLRTVGRGLDRDLVVLGDSVSREQFSIWKDGKHWVVEDSSRNGTLVGTHWISKGQRTEVDSDVTIFCGGIPVNLYCADSPHQAMIRSMVEDPVTGLLQRPIFLMEVDRVIRQRRDAFLVLFDVDGSRDLRTRIGPVETARLQRELATALKARCMAELGPCRLGQFADDEVAVLVESGDWEAIANAVARLRCGLVESPRTELSLSAAQTAVDLDVSVQDNVANVYDKLRQAKLAGGNRAAVSPVRIQWSTRGLDAWTASLRNVRGVALVFLRDADSWTPEKQCEVRQTIASGLDELPPGAQVQVGWSHGGQRWYLAASVGAGELRRVLVSLPHYMRRMEYEGADAVQWVEDRGRELAGMPERSELWSPFLKLFDRDAALEPSAQLMNAQVMLETVLRVSGNLVVALALAEFASSDSGPDEEHAGWASLLGAVETFEGRVGGATAWLNLLSSVASLTTSPIPAELGRWLSGKAEGEAHAAIRLRNDCSHKPMPPETLKQARHALWKVTRSLCEALPASTIELVAVDIADRIRAPGWTRITARFLQGLKTPCLEQRDVNAELYQGLWARAGDAWIPMSPLLEYRHCAHAKWDLFSAKSFGFGNDEVVLSATTHACELRVSIDPSNHREVRRLADGLCARRQR